MGWFAWLGWLGLAGSLAGRPQLAGCPCLACWLGWPDPFHNHSTTISQSFHNHSTSSPQSFHNHSTSIPQLFTIIPQSFHRLQNPRKSAFCGWVASWLAGGGWLARPGLGRLAWPGWLGLAGWPTPAGWLPVLGRLARPDSFHNHSTTTPLPVHNHTTIIPQSFHNHSAIIPQSFHNHSTDCRIPGNQHSVVGWPAGWLAAAGWLDLAG